MIARAGPIPPVEPVLEMHEIQGIVVPGFFKPHQTLLYARLPKDEAALKRFRHLTAKLAKEVSTAAGTLADRRAYRKFAARSNRSTRASQPLIALTFAYSGLSHILPAAYGMPSVAFKLGLVARSALLGDPTDSTEEGHPKNWTVGGPGNPIDVMIIVAGDTRRSVSEVAARLKTRLEATGAVVSTEDGDVRDDAGEEGHEHFGFDDGVSQPGIRGMATSRPGDYITERHIDPSEYPANALYGYPGQDLVWPGEFVLGYSASSPDPLVPGPPTPAIPSWTRNGSYLVFRRLRQDVGLFWRTMQAEANRLAQAPPFKEMTDDHLAALLVGRWQSGAPINRTPKQDIPRLGKDALANNNFRFDSDTPRFMLKRRRRDSFPSAKADPAGVTCPWAAHIRKVNTRDSASDMGGRNSTYQRRLLRVGVPFGAPLQDRYAEAANDPLQGNRGLLFLAVQSSIEDQFEFLQARWMNDATRPKNPGGNDMIVGQNSPAENGVRRCSLFGTGFAQAQVEAPAQWVIPTGGGYFFVPSISTLTNVIGGKMDA